MADISRQASMTTLEIITAIRQLGPVDLDKVAYQVTQLRMQLVTGLEAELLRVVRRRPRTFNRRYSELMGKRREETLTELEYQELLHMTDEAEAFDVQRIKAMSELASLRETNPDTLMVELGMARRG